MGVGTRQIGRSVSGAGERNVLSKLNRFIVPIDSIVFVRFDSSPERASESVTWCEMPVLSEKLNVRIETLVETSRSVVRK